MDESEREPDIDPGGDSNHPAPPVNEEEVQDDVQILDVDHYSNNVFEQELMLVDEPRDVEMPEEIGPPPNSSSINEPCPDQVVDGHSRAQSGEYSQLRNVYASLPNDEAPMIIWERSPSPLEIVPYSPTPPTLSISNSTSPIPATHPISNYQSPTSPTPSISNSPILTPPTPSISNSPILMPPSPSISNSPILTPPSPSISNSPILMPPSRSISNSPILTPPSPSISNSPILMPPSPSISNSPILTPPTPSISNSPILTPPSPSISNSPILMPPSPSISNSPILTPPSPSISNSPILMPPSRSISNSPILMPPSPSISNSPILAPPTPSISNSPILTPLATPSLSPSPPPQPPRSEFDSEATTSHIEEETIESNIEEGRIEELVRRGERKTYYCRICMIESNSYDTMNSHIRGIKHLKKKRERMFRRRFQSPSPSPPRTTSANVNFGPVPGPSGIRRNGPSNSLAPSYSSRRDDSPQSSPSPICSPHRRTKYARSPNAILSQFLAEESDNSSDTRPVPKVNNRSSMRRQMDTVASSPDPVAMHSPPSPEGRDIPRSLQTTPLDLSPGWSSIQFLRNTSLDRSPVRSSLNTSRYRTGTTPSEQISDGGRVQNRPISSYFRNRHRTLCRTDITQPVIRLEETNSSTPTSSSFLTELLAEEIEDRLSDRISPVPSPINTGQLSPIPPVEYVEENIPSLPSTTSGFGRDIQSIPNNNSVEPSRDSDAELMGEGIPLNSAQSNSSAIAMATDAVNRVLKPETSHRRRLPAQDLQFLRELQLLPRERELQLINLDSEPEDSNENRINGGSENRENESNNFVLARSLRSPSPEIISRRSPVRVRKQAVRFHEAMSRIGQIKLYRSKSGGATHEPGSVRESANRHVNPGSREVSRAPSLTESSSDSESNNDNLAASVSMSESAAGQNSWRHGEPFDDSPREAAASMSHLVSQVPLSSSTVSTNNSGPRLRLRSVGEINRTNPNSSALARIRAAMATTESRCPSSRAARIRSGSSDDNQEVIPSMYSPVRLDRAPTQPSLQYRPRASQIISRHNYRNAPESATNSTDEVGDHGRDIPVGNTPAQSLENSDTTLPQCTSRNGGHNLHRLAGLNSQNRPVFKKNEGASRASRVRFGGANSRDVCGSARFTGRSSPVLLPYGTLSLRRMSSAPSPRRSVEEVRPSMSIPPTTTPDNQVSYRAKRPRIVPDDVIQENRLDIGDDEAITDEDGFVPLGRSPRNHNRVGIRVVSNLSHLNPNEVNINTASEASNTNVEDSRRLNSHSRLLALSRASRPRTISNTSSRSSSPVEIERPPPLTALSSRSMAVSEGSNVAVSFRDRQEARLVLPCPGARLRQASPPPSNEEVEIRPIVEDEIVSNRLSPDTSPVDDTRLGSYRTWLRYAPDSLRALYGYSTATERQSEELVQGGSVNGSYEADLAEAIKRSLEDCKSIENTVSWNDTTEEVEDMQENGSNDTEEAAPLESTREASPDGGLELSNGEPSSPRPGCSHWSGGDGDVSSTSKPSGPNWQAKYSDMLHGYNLLLAKHLKLIADLQSSVECPICMEIPRSAPIPCCRNGHVMCSSCWSRSHQCPTCRRDLPPSERCVSHVANRLVDLLPHPCTNRDTGCGYEGPVNQLALHERDCEHRLIKCPSFRCKKQVSMKKLGEHISAAKVPPHSKWSKVEEHPLRATRVTVSSNGTRIQSFDPVRFVFEGRQCFLQTIASEDKTFIFHFVQMCGTRQECEGYTARIEVIGKGGISSLQSCRVTPLDLHCLDDLHLIGDRLVMQDRVFLNMVNWDQRHEYYSFKINVNITH